jgi:membrane protein implicated in regulation of membrane protease activity
MRDSHANHFLSGALATITLFALLWFFCFAAIVVALNVNIFNRRAQAVCALGALILAYICVREIGRWIARRDETNRDSGQKYPFPRSKK